MNLKFSSGLSMIELLLACGIASFILSVIFSMYFDINKSNILTNKMANFQDEVLFLESFVHDHLWRAGDIRCLSTLKPVDAKHALIGYHSSQVPLEWGIHALTNTDVLVVGECLTYQEKYQFVQTAYFIGDTHRENASGKIYALYQKIKGGKAEEIIPNINKMSILFGIKDMQETSISNYVSSDKVKDWTKIGSVVINFKDQEFDADWEIYTELRELL